MNLVLIEQRVRRGASTCSATDTRWYFGAGFTSPKALTRRPRNQPNTRDPVGATGSPTSPNPPASAMVRMNVSRHLRRVSDVSMGVLTSVRASSRVAVTPEARLNAVKRAIRTKNAALALCRTKCCSSFGHARDRYLVAPRAARLSPRHGTAISNNGSIRPGTLSDSRSPTHFPPSCV